jgi:hypothetical protein
MSCPYIASQRAEGWVLVPDRYDDGGFSGGTLEQQTDLELADLLKPFPIEWDKQEAFFNSRTI